MGAALFSFNSSGACSECKGLGQITIDMVFLDPVKSTCEACSGKRYNREALKYKLNGKSIVDVIEMTINQANDFFNDIEIRRRLQILIDVGLGYLKLGQALSTLSGGECQRIKLVSELQKEGRIYILDEPTTGLHMSDIARIKEIMSRLVDNGNSVIIIEHNLDVINNSDWIIDIEPEGGVAGGEVIFEGPPNQIILKENSHTGQYLKRYIENSQSAFV